MPTLSKEEKQLARTMVVADRKKLEPKLEIRKHIASIGAPGVLLETVADKSLMRLSSGDMAWYDTADLEDEVQVTEA